MRVEAHETQRHQIRSLQTVPAQISQHALMIYWHITAALYSLCHDTNEHNRPCTNCLKKSRVDLCKYAPKPVRNRPPKSMAARLKRLEGMVREMLDEDGNVRDPSSERTAVSEEDIDSDGDRDAGKFGAQVIRGAGARGGNTTYVGATHFMAMLGDVCVMVLLTVLVQHCYPMRSVERAAARELTLFVPHRSRTSRVTLTTRKSTKK